MEVTTTVPDQKIAYLLSSGFEGGVGYWCRIMRYRKPKAKDLRPVVDADRPEASREIYPYIDYPLLPGGAVICRRYEEETDRKYTPLVLDRAAIERGLRIMAKEHPRAFGDFMDDNFDANTGDVFIQCCLLGSVEYG